MTIASEICRLQTDKEAIRQAIISKWVDVSALVSLDDYASCIAQIEAIVRVYFEFMLIAWWWGWWYQWWGWAWWVIHCENICAMWGSTACVVIWWWGTYWGWTNQWNNWWASCLILTGCTYTAVWWWWGWGGTNSNLYWRGWGSWWWGWYCQSAWAWWNWTAWQWCKWWTGWNRWWGWWGWVCWNWGNFSGGYWWNWWLWLTTDISWTSQSFAWWWGWNGWNRVWYWCCWWWNGKQNATTCWSWWGNCATWAGWILILRYPTACWYNVTWWTKYTCWDYTIHCFTSNWCLCFN